MLQPTSTRTFTDSSISSNEDDITLTRNSNSCDSFCDELVVHDLPSAVTATPPKDWPNSATTSTSQEPPPQDLRSSESPSEPVDQKSRRLRRIIRRDGIIRVIIELWGVELFTWGIAAVFMGAVVVGLILMDDKPIRDWPLGISLNAYISVGAKIVTSGLLHSTSESLGQLKWGWFGGSRSRRIGDFELFDNASRGPWGSVLLVALTKGRSIATIGAIITVLSLGLETFIQQVVSVENRTVLQEYGSIARTSFYQRTPVYRQETEFNGTRIMYMNQEMDAILEPFFFGPGIDPVTFGNGTKADMPMFCPTSSCTWEGYESLAVCSTCEDVSEFLYKTCMDVEVDWFLNATEFEEESLPHETRTVCGHFFNGTTDNGTTAYLMSGYAVDPFTGEPGEALAGRNFPMTNLNSRRAYNGGTLRFEDIRNPMMDFLVVSPHNTSIESIYQQTPPGAQECLLYWCVKKFNSSYFYGTYHEEVIDTFHNTTEAPYQWTMEYRPMWPYDSFSNWTVTYDMNITMEPPGSNVSFATSNETAVEIAFVFDLLLPSYTVYENSSVDSRFRFDQLRTPKVRTLDVNPWIHPDNVSIHLEKLSTAMTNVIRSSSNSSDYVWGEAWGDETYFQVDWQWLTLPLVLIVASFGFLVATIFLSLRERNVGVGVWKTSALATLLNGLPGDVQNKINRSASRAHIDPREKARGMNVRLIPNQDGWRMSAQGVSKPKRFFEKIWLS
ncbi:hypothetical protein BDY21DRAFT_56718 [Lineolata rhizophorae]|uniref:Uncharacterized protein n=1 Tax=Lineolata rhizophorae TaxID=578093 RepID=A0A6A6NWK2_9PEZI|nr:hypothetical protein BDY21DRAFT_56718 [Lineolata rhizophorae]